MSILTYPLGFIGGGKEFYNGVIENSLRFNNDTDNAHVRRTPAITGNRRTFTWSGWIKSTRITGSQDGTLFGAQNDTHDSSSTGALRFAYPNDSLNVLFNGGSGGNVSSSVLLRDPSAWYHIVMAVDTTLATAEDRVKLFINGERDAMAGSPSTEPAQNYETNFNKNVNTIGVYGHSGYDGSQFDGYMTDIYGIDGYALGPENFGEYKEGAWIPKAYAGPPPIVSDSSSQNNDIVFNGASVGHLNYDEYYIGESSIEFGSSNAYSATIGNPNKIESGGPFDFTTEDWTIDFWIKAGPSVSGSHVTVLHAEGTDNPSPADFNNYVWLNFDASSAPTLYVYLSANGGPKSYMSASMSAVAAGVDQWVHVSVIRDNSQSLGQPGTSVIAGFGNGVQLSFTINAIGGTQEYITPTTNLATATYMDGKGMTLFGNNAYGYTSQVMDRKLDELRIVKGEASPPRFYFGTNYGDQSGGVMAHRATSAHRFTDDERTTLLVSGQSANGHARAVSLVDESGMHFDNVHYSNSTVANYPTQDGIGKQFTMSGPQHTTREAFIGNTSSIVFDGVDDYLEFDAMPSAAVGQLFTYDTWFKMGSTSRDGTAANEDGEFFNGDTGSGTFRIFIEDGGIKVVLSSVNADMETPYYGTYNDDVWHHLSVCKNTASTFDVKVDGVMLSNGAAKSVSSTAFTDGSGVGRIGYTDHYFPGYLDESRVSYSVDQPQIKWTHTQTAGAGNKDAYDIHGWRAHGHEFSDDNATSLLIHGSAYTGLKKATSFDGTDDYARDSDFPVPSGTSSRTIAVWSWMNQATDSPEGYIMSAGNASSNEDFALIVNNKLAFSAWANDFEVLPDALTPIYQWIFIVATYDGTTTKVYYNGELHKSESDTLATPTSGCTLTIAASDNGTANYGCYISNAGIWNRDLSAAEVKDLFLKGAGGNWTTDGPNGDYSASNNSYRTGSMSGTNTASTTGLIGWWAFGNHDDIATGAYSRTTSGANATGGSADTGSIIYDRSGHNKNLSDNNGISAPGGSPATFRDSSSANSIHHALVSGGGVHHSKAVTLKSDGTNGTSTTDPDANTIYWCGSNSTVTFANSSSFDYGNTAIDFNGTSHYLTVPASSDFNFNNSDFTISTWIYIRSFSGGNTTLLNMRSGGPDVTAFYINSSGDIMVEDWQSGTANDRAVDTGVVITKSTWHQVTIAYDLSDTQMKVYVDGIQKAETHFTAPADRSSLVPHIGSQSGTSSFLDGYMDEYMVLDGEMLQPRFYLGNQAPESGASFTTVKSFTFDGTDDYMTHSPGVFGDTNSNRSIVLWMRNRITDGTVGAYTLSEMNTSDYENSFFLYKAGVDYHVRAHYSSAASSSQLVTGVPLKTNGLEHMVIQLPDTSTGAHKIYLNGRLISSGTFPSSGTWGSSGGDMGLRVGGGLESTYAAVDFIQAAFYEGSDAHHTEAEVKAMYDLGPTGNLNTTYSTGLVAYYGFGNLDAVNVTGGTATADTVSTVYDRKASGTAKNLTQSTSGSQPTISTYYYPSNSAKRLAHGPLLYTTDPTGNTAILGNTHYANSTAQLSGTAVDQHASASFGSFVDDEYTVLLLRGGHADGNTVFYDGNTAAGETITFPAHSYSYGKTRTAELISPETNTTHEVTDQLGLHGSSIKTTGTSSGFLIGDDSVPGNNFDFAGDTSWCMEFWIYPNASPAGAYMGNMTPGTGPGHAGICIYDYNGGTGDRNEGILWANDAGTTYYWTTNEPVITNSTWQHVVVQHDSFGSTYATPGTSPTGHQNITMFVNGVNVAWADARSSDISYDNRQLGNAKLAGHTSHGKRFHIGYDMDNARINALWDEIRITKGIPRYTPDGRMVQGIVPNKATGAGTLGTLIPTIPYLRPTPYVATDGGRGYYANTNVKLWVKSDTFPGDANFYDSAGTIGNTPKAITNNGHTKTAKPLIKTANSITDYALSGGTDGIFFDGTNDYIEVPAHSDFDFENSDFTIEMWFKCTDASTGNALFDYKYDDFQVYVINSTAYLYVDIRDWTGTDTGLQSTTEILDGIWYHAIIDRLDGKSRLFLNGVCEEIEANDNIINMTAESLHLGARYNSGTGAYDYHHGGYIDEFRISNMARYTAQGLIDSDFPNPSTEFGIQTEGSTYGQLDEQVTANTTYQRYNYQHRSVKTYDFDGANDFIDAGSDAGTDQEGTMYQAYATWFRTDGAHSGTAMLCLIGDSGYSSGTNYAYWLNIAGTGGGTAELGTLASSSEPTSQGWAQIRSTQRYDDGKWHLAMLIHDSNQFARIYADGILVAETTAVCASSSTTGELNNGYFHGGFHIGDQSATSYEFKGRIGNVARWKYSSSSALNTKWTDSAIRDLYLEGLGANWATNHNSDMTQYYAMGTHTGGLAGTTEDSASTVYDRRTSGTAFNGAGTSMAAPSSDTKLLIHSNTDIDGDTSIVDSSPSEHKIDRIVADPVYANTGANRSSLAGATYNAIRFESDNGDDQLRVPHDDTITIDGDFTLSFWLWRDSVSANYNIINRGGIGSSDVAGWGVRTKSDGTVGFFDYSGTGYNMDFEKSGTSIFYSTVWGHIMYTRSGTNFKAYFNGTDVTSAGVFGSSTSASGYSSVGTQTLPLRIGATHSDTLPLDGYMDQVMLIKGTYLSSGKATGMYGGGNGNTAITNRHSLVVHEEYANNTVTVNTATTLLLHSNNSTHHSQGSRKFFNDVRTSYSDEFTGAGTGGFTGHGAFEIGAGTGIWNVKGVIGGYNGPGTTTTPNPLMRLKRGYSYIFDFADNDNSASHKFYFANSTANSTGYAYGGGDTTQPNAYITGVYGSNGDGAAITAGTATWTQFVQASYGSSGGDGTATGGFKYIKFEVPDDAPKNLYYRCSVNDHEEMGNAIFVMEQTEPAPIKVGTLPALRTSGWNDRDYVGIGTNNSVMKFDGTSNYLQMADHADFNLGTTFTIELWGNQINAQDQTWFSHATSGTNYWYFYRVSGGKSVGVVQDGTTVTRWKLPDGGDFKFNQWYHIVLTCTSGALALYVNGVKTDSYESSYSAVSSGHNMGNYTGTPTIGLRTSENNSWLSGYLDEFIIHKGTAYSANTVIQRYMEGRAGVHYTANSSCVLHVKADSTYGDTAFTDASPSAHTITNVGGVYHHIEDDRTANTALYFDGTSYISIPHHVDIDPVSSDYTVEAWFKTEKFDGNSALISKGGHGNSTDVSGISFFFGSAGQTYFRRYNGGTTTIDCAPGSLVKLGQWQHMAATRTISDPLSGTTGSVKLFIDGICVAMDDDSTADDDHDTGTRNFYIGTNHEAAYFFNGWMDGIRFTKGMPRYTSGIPTDGQSPHKKYDDGRSSNVSSNTWATSSTRRYYGINTHTYLQTTEYSTDANTVLMIRGDDAETANDGVNMYGDNGFHLEFKEVGSGTERDYNNFGTGVRGLGSDTSATQEFADDATLLLVRSRPNQANGSVQFINEVDQTELTVTNDAHHNETKSIFSVDANTANVSVSSGGSGTY